MKLKPCDDHRGLTIVRLRSENPETLRGIWGSNPTGSEISCTIASGAGTAPSAAGNLGSVGLLPVWRRGMSGVEPLIFWSRSCPEGMPRNSVASPTEPRFPAAGRASSAGGTGAGNRGSCWVAPPDPSERLRIFGCLTIVRPLWSSQGFSFML